MSDYLETLARRAVKTRWTSPDAMVRPRPGPLFGEPDVVSAWSPPDEVTVEDDPNSTREGDAQGVQAVPDEIARRIRREERRGVDSVLTSDEPRAPAARPEPPRSGATDEATRVPAPAAAPPRAAGPSDTH